MVWKLKRATTLCVLGSLLCLSRCANRGASDSEAREEYLGPDKFELAALGLSVSEYEEQQRVCEAKMREVIDTEPLPGAPIFEKNRVRIFMKAKGEPVFFTERPEYTDEEVSGVVKGFRQLVGATSYPWDAIGKLLPHFKMSPKDGRSTLLKNGYLFGDNPKLAHALVNKVKVEHLFGHDKIWLQRGENTYSAVRKRGKYYFADGPMEGDEVRLLHLDRLGHGAPAGNPLHRDFRSAQYRLGFNRVKVRHITQDHIVANLRYGKWWVPSVLSTTGARVELECEITHGGTLTKVRQAQAEERRRRDAVQKLRAAMMDQIKEALPFDEPIHEFGKQFDGKLRENWRWAYYTGQPRYKFNGDWYRVFDREGRPFIPQVCVDFLTDTIERASGSWYNKKGEDPGRAIGGMDFDALDVERAELRRVPRFIQFAKERPHWFDVYDTPPEEQIEMGKRMDEFYDYLEKSGDQYRSGDIVVIHGWAPWDRRLRHYHSFFIYENDPITGVPIAIVGNAGRPSVRVWEIEARRTPRRMIRHRVRLNLEWLEQITQRVEAGSELPLPLSPAGSTE